jgi:gamma-glutamyl phosphate reductase
LSGLAAGVVALIFEQAPDISITAASIAVEQCGFNAA